MWAIEIPPCRLETRGLEATSTARARQLERGHLLAIADQQEVTDQRGMVPGLAFERREPGELVEAVWGRRDQRQPQGFNAEIAISK